MRTRCVSEFNPVRERGADILPCQTVMGVAKALVVQHHVDAHYARASEDPSLNGQPPGDRFNHRTGNDLGIVDLEAKLWQRRRRLWGWRLGLWDQDGTDFLAERRPGRCEQPV